MSSNKKHQEKKAKKEQEAAAHIFQEFVDTFQNDYSSVGKTFVRSGVLYADENKLKSTVGQLYKPKPVIQTNSSVKNAIECARILKQQSEAKKKCGEKPKSNLELLKEELKQRHSEKSERDRIKAEIISAPPAVSYFEGGDPYSTNLFVANLSTSVTEVDLMKEFGTFGALASVKIMWPRGDDRNKLFGDTNCGFVAYMSRKDAERALLVMKNRQDMRVGWGKSVELPQNPVYIPPELLQYWMPPLTSGLPYNAQPDDKESAQYESLDDLLYNCVVKVTIPLNKKVLILVNRMVEFVVREGPMFEAMIMNNEIKNPEFSFLFDYKSPVHVYYRWKLFSVLQGDSVKKWEMKPFRMFKGASVWIPPAPIDFSKGMPEDLLRRTGNFTGLSDNQCDRLIQLIREATLRRSVIAKAMVFCLDHSNSINESIQIIIQSLKSTTSDPTQKIARLYLLSDVLCNCKKERIDIKFDQLQNVLTPIFKNNFAKTYEYLKVGDKDKFRLKVLRVLRQWDNIPLFSLEAIQDWDKMFPQQHENSLCNLDGVTDDNSSSDEPLDGPNLLKRSSTSDSTDIIFIKKEETEKVEALPLQFFVPSKWDTINPEDLQSQAVNSESIFYMEAKQKLAKEARRNLEKHLEDISSSSDEESYYSAKNEKSTDGAPERTSKGKNRNNRYDSTPEHKSSKNKTSSNNTPEYKHKQNDSKDRKHGKRCSDEESFLKEQKITTCDDKKSCSRHAKKRKINDSKRPKDKKSKRD